MKKVPVKVKKLNPKAIIPKYQTEGAAGFDLHANNWNGETDFHVTLYPGQTTIFGTGLAMEIPEGYEIQIRGRSGLAFKHAVAITHGVGTIDSDYRGEIKIILTNHGNIPVVIKPGDRMAQGILKEVPIADFVEVEELEETERGDGGFGHTGK